MIKAVHISPFGQSVWDNNRLIPLCHSILKSEVDFEEFSIFVQWSSCKVFFPILYCIYVLPTRNVEEDIAS